MFSLLHNVTNEEYLCNQSSYYIWKIQMTPIINVTGKSLCSTANRQLSLSVKRNETQRRTKVSPWCMRCTYCGIPKGTCQAGVMSNCDKIKPVALVVTYLAATQVAVRPSVLRFQLCIIPVVTVKLPLCWSEGISQSIRQRKLHE